MHLGRSLDLFLPQAALVVCDGDLPTLASALVISDNFHDIVDIKLDGLL